MTASAPDEQGDGPYEGDMTRFAEWCAQVGRRPLPAAPQTVTEYLSYLKRTPRPRTGRPYGPKTMDRIIASIRSSHRAAGYQPPDTMGARKVVAGYREQLALAQDPAAQPRKASPADRTVLRFALAEFYAGSPIIAMGEEPLFGELLLRRSREPSDRMELFVFASPDGTQARLVAVLDNLGKGASGAAVQSLNLMAGLDETAGLRL